MIKYLTFDAFDDYGQHIIPINTDHDLTKVASNNYSSEVAKVIANMVRKPEMFYVVINALGSYEVWGINGNGDSFPREALSHLSLRSDLGTPNDYGYKTFEYYAKLFKHHVNKPDSPSYGEVVFSHWNPDMERVELIVGIDRFRGKDMVEALENGGNVAVSMGCKVPFDECSVCGNRAKTRAQYCKHTKNYLRKVIDERTAAQWSKELGKTILPGTKVHVINRKPRFFDISKVHIGADRTAYVLGKAASDGEGIASVDVAEAYGVTDDFFDKIAAIGKSSEIEKEVGSMGPDDIDGRMSKIDRARVIGKALKERMSQSIDEEPMIDRAHLNMMAERNPLGRIIKGMLDAGVFPKPREFQRMSLVRAGHHRLADELDDRGVIFNHKSCGREIPFTNNYGNSNHISDSLSHILNQRSFLPGFNQPRIIKITLIKRASNRSEDEVSEILEPIAAMYNGIKKYASQLTPSMISEKAKGSSLLRRIVGLAAYLNLVDKIEGSDAKGISNIPASDFEGVLQDTNFSGLMDYSGEKVASQLLDAVVLPGAYIDSAVKQSAFSDGKEYINNDWMSKQASVNDIMYQATSDINNILFDA